MSQTDFNHLLQTLTELTPEQLQQLRRQLDNQLTAVSPPSEAEAADQDVQRRLLEAGIISEIKPPIRDVTPYLKREAVPIQGEPLSETVIRERR